MNIEAFRKACFDLVYECDDVRATDPASANLLIKNDDDGLWIRFIAIGSLLDYCENNETESVFAHCIKGVAIAMIIEDLLKRDQK